MCNIAKKIRNVKCETIRATELLYPEFAARRATRCFFFLKKIVVIKIQYTYIFVGHDLLPYKIIDYRPLDFSSLGPSHKCSVV